MTLRTFVTLLSLLWLASLNATANPDNTLQWVGCGISKKAYVTDLARAFEQKTGIHINIEGGGATKGIRKVLTGEADLGGSCRYRLPEDPRESRTGLEPVAWDALAVITHKDNPVESLTSKEVQDIFLGKITNWKQVGGPDQPILLYTRKSKYSGVGRTLRKLIFANYDQEIASTRQFKSSGPLEKSVVETPFSLGISGISSARLRDLKIMKLNGVYPTFENVKSGDYQLYRPLYITYNPLSDKIDKIKQFISFCHSPEGRDIMKQNGTLPYRDAVHLVMKQIDQDLAAFRRGAKMSDRIIE